MNRMLKKTIAFLVILPLVWAWVSCQNATQNPHETMVEVDTLKVIDSTPKQDTVVPEPVQKPEPVKKQSQISAFDKSIKKTAKNIGWDWRLLASLIYQESRFKTELESEKGAYGLMQLMPVIMEQYDIDYDSSPEEQIAAGGKLIRHIDRCLEKRVADSSERVKFVLAAYNAGLGHVYDAQRLAEKYGKEPDVWTDNVDFFILNKSQKEYYNDSCCQNGYLRGTQTYRFVEKVLERYEHYKTIID